MRKGWEYKKLGEVCSPKSKIQRATKCFGASDEILYIDISSIDNSVQEVNSITSFTMSNAPSRAQQKVEYGDIIVSTVRPNLKNVAFIKQHDSNLVASSGFCVLRTTDDIERNYLFHYITSDIFTQHLMKLTTGANYPAVRDSDVRDSVIPLPPQSTQLAIVSELDKINELIRLKKEQLKDFDNLAQSLFYEMFGDPVENEKGWEVKKLGELLKVIGGYAFKSNKYKEEGIPILRIGNINSGVFRDTNLVFAESDEKLERYKIFPGDIVISLTGTVGKSDYGNVCIMDDAYNFYYLNQRNAKLEIFGNLEKYYLSAILKNEVIKSRLTSISRGVRQANIANKDIENLQIPLPPLPLQHLFAQRIEQIEREKSEVQKSIKDLETLLASRMQYWFE